MAIGQAGIQGAATSEPSSGGDSQLAQGSVAVAGDAWRGLDGDLGAGSLVAAGRSSLSVKDRVGSCSLMRHAGACRWGSGATGKYRATAVLEFANTRCICASGRGPGGIGANLTRFFPMDSARAEGVASGGAL